MNDFDTIFNIRSGILTFFGALGGTVRWAALKTSWKEGLRVMFMGSATAFGVGVLAPYILHPWIGDIPADMVGALGTLCAMAFLTGLMSVTIIERLLAGKSFKDDDNGKE